MPVSQYLKSGTEHQSSLVEQSPEQRTHSAPVVSLEQSPSAHGNSNDDALSLPDAPEVEDVEERMDEDVASDSEKKSHESSSNGSFIVQDDRGKSNSDYAPSNSAEVFSDPESESSVRRGQRYTVQELVVIALVAAGGRGMTTSQIILWVARHSSRFQVGKGAWEQDVRVTLSRSDDFKATRINGVFENKRLWNFTTPAIAIRYTEKYRDFDSKPTPPTDDSDPHDDPVTQMPKTQGSGSNVARKTGSDVARSSALSSSKSMSKEFGSLTETEMVSPIKLKDLPLRSAGSEHLDRGHTPASPMCEDPPYKFLERTTPRHFPETLTLDFNTLRVANYDILPAISHKSPSETMTDAEKAQKIAEIKSRPSRKSYFGSDHKLEHKRRHRLADIHDEGGSWKFFARKAGVADKYGIADVDLDAEKGGPTLRELLNLPEKTIPMNVDKDIAFRDATLVYLLVARACVDRILMLV